MEIVHLQMPTGDRPIIDRWDCEPCDAVARLSHVGLSDPFTWARRPAELSEGQKHRLAIADALWSGADVVVIDDALTTLDHTTTCAVAWRLQAAARDLGVGLIVCTPKNGLFPDLQPDWWVRIGWTPEPIVERIQEAARPCSLLADIEISEGCMADYRAVQHLHYAAGCPAFVDRVFTARHPGIEQPAAVLVTTHPEQMSAARNDALAGLRNRMSPRNWHRWCMRHVRRIARVVVSPEVRGIGLGTMIVKHAVENSGAEVLEVLTQQARFSGWLYSAGFRLHPHPNYDPAQHLENVLRKHGIHEHAALSGQLLAEATDALTVRPRREVRKAVWNCYHHFVLWRRERRPKPARIPNPADSRWAEAWEIAASRSQGRPDFWYHPSATLTPDL